MRIKKDVIKHGKQRENTLSCVTKIKKLGLWKKGNIRNGIIWIQESWDTKKSGISRWIVVERRRYFKVEISKLMGGEYRHLNYVTYIEIASVTLEKKNTSMLTVFLMDFTIVVCCYPFNIITFLISVYLTELYRRTWF